MVVLFFTIFLSVKNKLFCSKIEQSGYITMSYSKTQKIYAEYLQQKLVKSILANLAQEYPGQAYELSNILERWLLSTINFDESKDTCIILRRTNRSNQYSIKAASEIVEKRITDLKSATEAWNRIVAKPVNLFVKDCPKHFKAIKLPIKFYKDKITVKDHEIALNPFIVKRLKRFKPNDIRHVLLRYSSIIAGSQHWSVGFSMYNHLYTRYNVRWEGFSSPLNSKLLGRPGARFCSLFYDTDQPFGSLGSIFKTDLLNPLKAKKPAKSIAWTINPPYVIDILNLSSIKILRAVKRAMQKRVNLFIWYIMPAWTDSKAYLRLHNAVGKKNSGVVYEKILLPSRHFYENQGKRIISRFASVIFILSSSKKPVKNLESICDPMMC